MIDGITIKYLIKNFDEWRRSVNLSFITNVETETGEIRTKKRGQTVITTLRGKWETFDLIIKEVLNNLTREKVFHLTMKGSLHKNHYRGSNYLPFTFQDLQEQINHLTKTLCIDAERARISTLEIGLNICTPFEVTPFLRQNIISYKGNSFNRYKPNREGICLGIVSQLSQYAVKIYDKGLQNNLADKLMRFEKRFLKMYELKKDRIKYLSDLLSYVKVEKLLPHLLEAWENVSVYDIDNLEKLPLKKPEIDLLTKGQNFKFWEETKKTFTSDQYKYQKNKFKKLVEKYGNNWQTVVNDLLKTEWENLFKNYPNLPHVQNHLLPEFTIKIKGKNGEKNVILKKKYCLSCGKEVNPAQKNNSTFCSAMFVGEAAAHKCRNNNSNPRNNRIRKIHRINSKGVLFDIAPFVIEKKRKSLKTHSREII